MLACPHECYHNLSSNISLRHLYRINMKHFKTAAMTQSLQSWGSMHPHTHHPCFTCRVQMDIYSLYIYSSCDWLVIYIPWSIHLSSLIKTDGEHFILCSTISYLCFGTYIYIRQKCLAFSSISFSCMACTRNHILVCRMNEHSPNGLITISHIYHTSYWGGRF